VAQARDVLSVKQFSATSDNNGGRGGGRDGGRDGGRGGGRDGGRDGGRGGGRDGGRDGGRGGGRDGGRGGGSGRGRGTSGRWTGGRGTSGRGTGNSSNNSRSEVHFMQISSQLQQAIDSGEIINKDWILLDTGSTSNGFCNMDLITNIRNCSEEEKLKIIANGSGSLIFNKIGKSKIFEDLDVHYNDKSVANILSFNIIANQPGVESIAMNTNVENAILVYFSDGSGSKFISDDRGLYYYDTKHPDNHKINPPLKPYSSHVLLNTTVSENEKLFSQQEVAATKRALPVQLHERLGWPSKYHHILENY